MADTTKIEWTDATWNPITGCTLVSDGCRHCYAARLAATRLKHHPSREGLARLNAAGEAKFTGEVRFNEQWLDQPLRWRKPRMIFVCAHGDLFHEDVPDEWIDWVFAVMALCPQHTFQVLTKRPERGRVYLRLVIDAGRHLDIQNAADKLKYRYRQPTDRGWPLPNVWIGTSVENQATANERIPHLLSTPAAVRFVSAEPLLGPVNFARMEFGGNVIWGNRNALTGRETWLEAPGEEWAAIGQLGWIIVGGEIGPKARDMNPDWARSIQSQCADAGTAFFMKQMARKAPIPDDLMVREMPA